ncbi:unnamed protein product [Darwinula stevensoni]|uniref:Uncharacterized protein n=1 Tax=Darwinula stevensoni TaxID=69355 RepID=A0A7R9A1T8_9CRUS|nr:unnamed protein product [Darwinula stevensoni]CAG0884307.1 unnamed protein product [Darwinula stevensoni]
MLNYQEKARSYDKIRQWRRRRRKICKWNTRGSRNHRCATSSKQQRSTNKRYHWRNEKHHTGNIGRPHRRHYKGHNMKQFRKHERRNNKNHYTRHNKSHYKETFRSHHRKPNPEHH